MEGAASDLRTGLPSQMIEIHEPMRLLAVVEQTTEMLTAIYRRQPPLGELVGNGWVQLVAKDPDSGEIHLFAPGPDRKGDWIPWRPSETPVRRVKRSIECYAGESEPCPPALIAAPNDLIKTHGKAGNQEEKGCKATPARAANCAQNGALIKWSHYIVRVDASSSTHRKEYQSVRARLLAVGRRLEQGAAVTADLPRLG